MWEREGVLKFYCLHTHYVIKQLYKLAADWLATIINRNKKKISTSCEVVNKQVQLEVVDNHLSTIIESYSIKWWHNFFYLINTWEGTGKIP